MCAKPNYSLIILILRIINIAKLLWFFSCLTKIEWLAIDRVKFFGAKVNICNAAADARLWPGVQL